MKSGDRRMPEVYEVLIERTDEVPPMFFSLKVGRDYASPSGGWTSDRLAATVFNTADTANAFIERQLAPQAPFCKVVEL
jgi:hypothetical protein